MTELSAEAVKKRDEFAEQNWNTFNGALVPAALGWTDKQLIKIGFNQGHDFAKQESIAEIEKLEARIEALRSALDSYRGVSIWVEGASSDLYVARQALAADDKAKDLK